MINDPNTILVGPVAHQGPGVEIRRASWDGVPGYVVFVSAKLFWASDWDLYTRRGPRRVTRAVGLAFVPALNLAPADRDIRQILADVEYQLPQGGQEGGN